MTTIAPVYHKTAALAEPGQKQRIASIDILRGLVMVIMAVDHVRDFYSYHHPEPTDLANTTALLFFTRFITHFCAPAFVFLNDKSAYLAGTRRTHSQLSAFLIKRGLWLIVVELVLINLAITADPTNHAQIFQVIWAIGGSMVILGLLVWARLSLPVIFTIGMVIVLGHNIFDPQNMPVDAVNNTVWGKLLISGKGFGDFWQYAPTRVVLFAYALLPWAGLMMIGYVLGSLYVFSFVVVFWCWALLFFVLVVFGVFFVLRFFNIYGDTNPWASQKTTTLSIISFFNVTKYPPSLLYTCMTVGTALLILAFTENVKNKVTSI